MKITTHTDAAQLVTRELKDIPVDTVFSGRIAPYEPSVFLRAYKSVVDLANPGLTWPEDGGSLVHNFVPFPNAEVILRR